MTVSDRLRDAASVVSGGDQSMVAAHELESVLLDEYLGDDRVSALVEALALYSPGSGSPYVDALELRKLIESTLLELAGGYEPHLGD